MNLKHQISYIVIVVCCVPYMTCVNVASATKVSHHQWSGWGCAVIDLPGSALM